MNTPLSLATTATLTPLRAGLREGHDNTLEVLLRIQAPAAPAGHGAERPPQALALVIDRSGSMAGRPLAEARRCAEYVVGTLRPTDVVSLVQFDNRVRRLWPAVPLGDGAPLRAALRGIEAGGNTDLHGGWLDGANSLGQVPGTGLKRVVLLSDGQANAGLTDADAIAAQCAGWAARGITTSTYGLGEQFNEELMVAIARAGAGNAYYGETAADLMGPFQQELALLGNLCLRELRLRVSTPDGVAVAVLNELPQVDGAWCLPDLAWGAQAWAVLRLRVDREALPALGSLPGLLQVTVQGSSLDGEAVALERVRLAVPVLAEADFDRLAADATVQRRLTELAAAAALAQLRAAAHQGDWRAVDRLLAEAQQRFADNDWVAALLGSMKDIAGSRSRERVMKESAYSTNTLRNRLVAQDEGADYSAAAEALSQPAYLRRKATQGKGEA